MTDKLTLAAHVTYGDVDRGEVILLPRLFKLLQEAAIAHANLFGTGTQAIVTRGEAWVLHRIAARIARYPRHDERLRVETWSSGIRGFRGWRDFRVFDAAGAELAAASSVWLYVSVRTKAIVRVPREIVDGFPVCAQAAAVPGLDKLPPGMPGPGGMSVAVSLRFSDFDVHEHVNNAAYFDLVQTALVRTGGTPHPRRIDLHYARAIPAGAERVLVRVERTGGIARFAIEGDAGVFAQGEAEE